ncbi:hypothetical protein [Tanticharoenia sakaeratensis]|jgi:hypothetical protein|uniref:Lipoprotein n=1 Tax=Tanticharoenia sakaeratensis NBRC 103193 TaxID=1231623 RepID=A0A0D6MGX0_9PROT|nr:hypothetical protein [Tanticharoenia sakaeratensis]GAN52862.1 hypothetical protein Tasa_003_040 [Tanticharoenia sakaeratensis NBRC 103193]
MIIFSRLARPLSAMAFATALGLAACGQMGAPTKADIKQVVQNYMQAQNEKASANTLGLFSGPYDPADLDISNADCTSKDNAVYSCAVTATTKKGTHTANLNLKKVNGAWQLVDN